MYKLSSRAQPAERGITQLHGCHGFLSLSRHLPLHFSGATCFPDIYLEASRSEPELRKLCSGFSNCSKRGKRVQRFREAGTELKYKAQGFSPSYSCCCCSCSCCSTYLQILTCLSSPFCFLNIINRQRANSYRMFPWMMHVTWVQQFPPQPYHLMWRDVMVTNARCSF